MNRLALASGSRHKQKEFQMLLAPLGIEVLLPKDLNLDFGPDETENTFLGNSFIKSKELFRLTGLPSIADDSGISVDALGNAPGVFSARYGYPDFTDRERALFLLKNLGDSPDRRAHYTCSLTYVDNLYEVSFEGRVDGEITFDYDEKNEYGFGYDPIFFYPPLGKRFSEIPEMEKNKVSHRFHAFSKFLEWFNKTF